MSENALALAHQLIREKSITPDRSRCHERIAAQLRPLGFTVENLSFNGVNNLWAYMEGRTEELFVFCGHTDVVPPGDAAAWHHPPFSARLDKEHLYGRGAVDMKSSIAAMMAALQLLLRDRRPHRSIGILITADEEGPALNGVRKALEELHKRGMKIHYCLVGEPTSEEKLGDMMKNGRRGSLSLSASLSGIEGHSAYIDPADNVLHRLLMLGHKLIQEEWDGLGEDGPGGLADTIFNITSIRGLSAAENMTAPSAEMKCNWRFSPLLLPSLIRKRAGQLLQGCTLSWQLGALPYLSSGGKMEQALKRAIKEECGIEPKLSTGGGTSDGRFFADYGAKIVEFGPRNATMHKANECISLKDLKRLTAVYHRFGTLFLV